MSRVARAARVASRTRPEEITAATTLSAADTGKLFLINYNAGATIQVTLPPVQEGAFFRFLTMNGSLAAASSQVDIASADGAGTMKGTVLCLVAGSEGVDTEIATNKDDGTDTKISLIGNTMHVGTYVEIHCDGTNWQVDGVAIASARTKAVFA